MLLAQNDDDIYVTSSTNENEWQQGYVVFRKHLDTLKGYLNIKVATTEDIKKIWFRKDKEVRKGTLKIGGDFNMPPDTLIYFGTANKNYKYVDYTDNTIPTKRFFQSKNSIAGWMEVIENGAIDIMKGFSVNIYSTGGAMVPAGGGGGMMTGGSSKTVTPMYYLKKANSPAVLIAAPSISIFRADYYMSYKIDGRNKDHFINVISDYSELAEKIKNKDLQFKEIESIVREYNQWVINNNK